MKLIMSSMSSVLLLQLAASQYSHCGNFHVNFESGLIDSDTGYLVFDAQPVLEGISNVVKFKNPKAPQWPRLALGKEWNEVRSKLHLWWSVRGDL